MMASVPAYNKYAQELGPQTQKVLRRLKVWKNKDYTYPIHGTTFKYYYTEHILRMPIDEWPEAINRSFNHMNPNVYVYMQGQVNSE
jgi:proline iminopeptidase